MKKVKFWALVACAIIILFAATGCEPSEKQMALFDDDEKIATAYDTFLTVGSIESRNKSEFLFSAKSFTGMKTIATIVVATNPELALNIEIGEGEFKIVFVKDSVVYTITDKDCRDKIETVIPAGEYDVKLVGRKTEVKFDMDFACVQSYVFK